MVALTAPLDTVGMDEDRVGDPAPFAHEPRAWLQRDRGRGFNRAAVQRIGGGLLQLPCGGHGEAAICPLLKLVNDPSDQEVAGEPHRRLHAMKPAPLSAKLEDGQRREPHERLCDIDRRFVHVSERAAFRCDSGERRCWAFGFLLAVHILSQVKAIERLTREVETLRADNAKLRAKLNLPSKTPENSSTPPSQGHKVSGEERKTPEGKRRNSHAGGTSDKA